jgi:hypothetical protein
MHCQRTFGKMHCQGRDGGKRTFGKMHCQGRDGGKGKEEQTDIYLPHLLLCLKDNELFRRVFPSGRAACSFAIALYLAHRDYDRLLVLGPFTDEWPELAGVLGTPHALAEPIGGVVPSRVPGSTPRVVPAARS